MRKIDMKLPSFGDTSSRQCSGTRLEDIKPPVSCGSAGLTFEAKKVPGKQRVDGILSMTAYGLSWPANSGSTHLLPLPAGWYLCRHLRRRSEGAMVRDGVGFSVDLKGP